jgi:hypothetical protein
MEETVRVEWHRETRNGERMVQVVANDCAKQSSTIRQWIKMLLAAERWLKQREKPAKPKP